MWSIFIKLCLEINNGSGLQSILLISPKKCKIGRNIKSINFRIDDTFHFKDQNRRHPTESQMTTLNDDEQDLNQHSNLNQPKLHQHFTIGNSIVENFDNLYELWLSSCCCYIPGPALLRQLVAGVEGWERLLRSWSENRLCIYWVTCSAVIGCTVGNATGVGQFVTAELEAEDVGFVVTGIPTWGTGSVMNL